MKKQVVITIQPEAAEKRLNGLIQEGYQVVSMVNSDLGILVVLELNVNFSEVKDGEIVRGKEMLERKWLY